MKNKEKLAELVYAILSENDERCFSVGVDVVKEPNMSVSSKEIKVCFDSGDGDVVIQFLHRDRAKSLPLHEKCEDCAKSFPCKRHAEGF